MWKATNAFANFFFTCRKLKIFEQSELRFKIGDLEKIHDLSVINEKDFKDKIRLLMGFFFTS